MKKFGYSAKTLITLAGLAIASSACSEGTAEPIETEEKSPAQTSETMEQKPQMKRMGTREQIAFAIEDLAERLSIDPTTVIFSGATPVNWRSGALGCPEPGMNYTQALVPGLWIMLKVDKTVYRYHSAAGTPPFFCPDDRAEPPAPGPGAT